MILTDDQTRRIVEEIQGDAEVSRRALVKRRHDIYNDGGKAFLIENILREFGRDALGEMRITPINLLKKIVDKRAGVYRKSPIRKAENPQDQALVDYYTKAMSFNELMQKANRYLALASNTVVYFRPHNGEIKACVVPAYQYSIVPNPIDQTVVDAYIFSTFVQEGRVAPDSAPIPATGVQSYNQQRGFKHQGDLVASNEKASDFTAQKYMFWTAMEQFTTDKSGNRFMEPGQDDTQYQNPIGIAPVVNVARDRDNIPWAPQGEDMVDLTIALQMGWTDVMTIAKHQGFSILTITSEEEPKKLTIGVNRAVWLKTNPQGPQPSIGYVQGNSPLAQYKELLTELLGLLLTTNNMDPNAIGGKAASKNFTSGFHALIAMADSLEAIEADKPIMLSTEMQSWEIISKWHNWMFDVGVLNEEAKAYGKFTEDFSVSVMYGDVTPIESEDERIARVEKLINMGLITKKDAIKKLQPELTDDQVDAKLLALQTEKSDNMTRAQEMFGGDNAEEETQETEILDGSQG
jgi:hypothetical protein